MSLENMTLKAGATITVTDGTDIVFGKDAVAVVGGIHLVDVAEDDFRDRYQLTFKSKPPVLDNKTGRLSKQKHAFSIARPYVHTDGSIEFQSLHVDLSTIAGSASGMEMLGLAAQILTSASTEAYFTRGVIS